MERIDLAGTWRLVRETDRSERAMAIPGDIASALLAAGEIPDPFFGENELGIQWIGREDWLLVREFDLPKDFMSTGSQYLEIEVLDTLAEIRLNGDLVGTSDSMFRRFRAEVGARLKPGLNRLELRIGSPERAAIALAAALPYPIPASTYPGSSPHRNLLRKAQCMGGWDWGPAIMTGGIYDGISLVATEAARIEYATCRMRREGEAWRVRLRIEVMTEASGAGTGPHPSPVPRCGELEAWIGAGTGRGTGLEGSARAAASLSSVPGDAPAVSTSSSPVPAGGAKALAFARSGPVPLPAGLSLHELELLVPSPELWWPAGHGGQPLYPLEVRLSVDGAPSHALSKRIGFRELELVAEEDAEGRSMKFRVNGREIFAKGANWIPADALPSRWTRGRIADLLGSAVDANMNCLRVWGGGRYESEDFYELCDELGILVWQDFMFSCALYPSSPAFLASVEAEARHQVLRLMDHPSIALWCGNNEALGAIGWYEESKRNPARYIVDYDRLTEGTVGRIVRELDPDRAWWPSSPSAGPNDFSDNWHADGRGDMHYWTVWHEGKPFSAYLEVRPRFCSEFGFQSFPSEREAAAFAPPGERNVTSPAFEHHQRHPRGNTVILETMSRYFRMPRGYRETLWLSQVQQALAIGTAVEYWRSLRPRCMGTLYWQLNDVWPAASWSSLDYGGAWKLLHHAARRFYDPLLLTLRVEGSRVVATGVNDTESEVAGRLTLVLRRFDGEVAGSWESEARLRPEAATPLRDLPLAELGASPREAYLEARLEGRDSGGKALRRDAFLFLTEPKRCSLVEPGIAPRVVSDPRSGGILLALRAKAPAFWVTPILEGRAGRFADSGFHLGPGEERLLRYLPARNEDAPDAETLSAGLRVMELRGSYD